MKRFRSKLAIMMAMVVFAANKNLEKDITMVSYEQSSIDVRGTLALKNNTKEEVISAIQESKTDALKSANINRWLIVAGIIILAILQFVFK